jgi:hypothetical protein
MSKRNGVEQPQDVIGWVVVERSGVPLVAEDPVMLRTPLDADHVHVHPTREEADTTARILGLRGYTVRPAIRRLEIFLEG